MWKKMFLLGLLSLILISCWGNSFSSNWEPLTLHIKGMVTDSIKDRAISEAVVTLFRRETCGQTKMKDVYTDKWGKYNIVFTYPGRNADFYLIANKKNYQPSKEYYVMCRDKTQKINIELTQK